MFIEIITVIFICLLSYVFLNSVIKKDTFDNYFNNTKNKVYSIINKFNQVDKTNDDKLDIKILSNDDIQNILNFLKSHFNYNHIIISKNLNFEKTDNEILFNNIEIIGFKDNIKNVNNISFKFTYMKDNIFISNYNLQNINGYFTLIETKKESNIIINKNSDDKIQIDTIFNYIPETINITSESELEIDSIVETTENNSTLYA
uniref:Uncharacterized protein n=1 Tax=viral metagenome TaxID=1070528 RepID=A0A6C0J3G3_9ZZZZ